ncbi:hypothetical protein ACFO25_20045 [Paenactinomyces guangxiensis]|uniref:Uncharacterized protein n=1 Tax=Paenactinomyces guangxiensis TaxID=1490290 RepID=A0A7W2AA06_9BACL|nr:hypothetical protein [Paenactinomyces guangxiensis]MBA4495784.1 hypothetical protein [Paenactinomyces guangxiensis]MBH8592874.1 hypothetical protein [Paenactinomyces guangxiensis]
MSMPGLFYLSENLGFGARELNFSLYWNEDRVYTMNRTRLMAQYQRSHHVGQSKITFSYNTFVFKAFCYLAKHPQRYLFNFSLQYRQKDKN